MVFWRRRPPLSHWRFSRPPSFLSIGPSPCWLAVSGHEGFRNRCRSRSLQPLAPSAALHFASHNQMGELQWAAATTARLWKNWIASLTMSFRCCGRWSSFFCLSSGLQQLGTNLNEFFCCLSRLVCRSDICWRMLFLVLLGLLFIRFAPVPRLHPPPSFWHPPFPSAEACVAISQASTLWPPLIFISRSSSSSSSPSPSSSHSSYFCLLLRARPRRPRRRLLCSLSWGRLCILCCLRAPSFSATTATCSARSFSFKSSTPLLGALKSPETRNSAAAVTAIRTIPDAGIFSQYPEAAIAASLTGSHGLCGRPRHRSIQNFIRNPSGMRRVRCR